MDQDDRLPPELLTALASLPRGSAPPPGEEDRTVRALRRRGLLPVSRWRRYTAYASGVAAAVALFAAGSMAGTRRARAALARANAAAAWPAPVSNIRSAALRVQRAGSEYVGALVQFAAISDASRSDPGLAAGRESAVATLCAAAAQLSRVAPEAPPATVPCDDAASAQTRTATTIRWF